MTGEGADALDRDTRLAAAPEEVAAAHADAVQRDLHTMLPGIIKEYDATKQTVTVQPALKRTFYGQDAVDLPLCTDVPVVFPAGGPLVMTFPITAEDECRDLEDRNPLPNGEGEHYRVQLNMQVLTSDPAADLQLEPATSSVSAEYPRRAVPG